MLVTTTLVALASMAVGAEAQVDLRLAPTQVPQGPTRELEEDETSEAEEEPEEADEEITDDERLEEVIVPEPPPPRAPPRARGPRTSLIMPSPAPRGGRAPNLFAQLVTGARGDLALGGRTRNARLALAIDVELVKFAWTLGRQSDESSVLGFGVVTGPAVAYYFPNAPLYLRGGAGLAGASIDTTVQVGTELHRGEYFTVMPSMHFGAGGDWRPSGTFGRFRLGLLLGVGLSTLSHAGDRMYLLDINAGTAITWF